MKDRGNFATTQKETIKVGVVGGICCQCSMIEVTCHHIKGIVT